MDNELNLKCLTPKTVGLPSICQTNGTHPDNIDECTTYFVDKSVWAPVKNLPNIISNPDDSLYGVELCNKYQDLHESSIGNTCNACYNKIKIVERPFTMHNYCAPSEYDWCSDPSF